MGARVRSLARLAACATTALVAAACVVSATGWPARAAEIDPEADLCAAINALQPGEELILQPGDYRGPCVIRNGGTPGAPVVIRGADPERRPLIVYPGASVNLLEVRA